VVEELLCPLLPDVGEQVQVAIGRVGCRPEQLSEPFARAAACLQQQDPAIATAAAGALFATLIELLVTFIGKPLTTRLLRQAWPDVFVDARSEER